MSLHTLRCIRYGWAETIDDGDAWAAGWMDVRTRTEVGMVCPECVTREDVDREDAEAKSCQSGRSQDEG